MASARYGIIHWRKTRMRKIIVVGTFDILHLGHLWLLNKAKEYGDWLTVVVARDETVRLIKGKKPVFPEEERLELLKNLKMVDEAVLGYLGDRFRVIEELQLASLVDRTGFEPAASAVRGRRSFR